MIRTTRIRKTKQIVEVDTVLNLTMVCAETSFHGLVLGQFDLGENGLSKLVCSFGLSYYLG